jgi:hypothetical protein
MQKSVLQSKAQLIADEFSDWLTKTKVNPIAVVGSLKIYSR